MKKFVIACAVILAGVLSSCGDTNYCYEVTATINVLGTTVSQTFYVWGTSNDLDASMAELDAEMEASGISKDSYTVEYKKTKKRVFKMAPVHHHFEKCGWRETKVVALFSIITLVLCAICYLAL
jgi:hypothetical protein